MQNTFDTRNVRLYPFETSFVVATYLIVLPLFGHNCADFTAGGKRRSISTVLNFLPNGVTTCGLSKGQVFGAMPTLAVNTLLFGRGEKNEAQDCLVTKPV